MIRFFNSSTRRRHTYLFDEAEQYDYTGLLMRLMNAGHRHDGQAWGRDGRKVPIFAPMALFRRFDPRHEPGLAPTVSRSILIEMKQRDPKDPEHKREEFRGRNRYVRRLPVLKQQITRVVENRKNDFAEWRPETEFLAGNRNADNWEPLVAIADLAGGHWSKTVRELANATAREIEAGPISDDAWVPSRQGRRPPWPASQSVEELRTKAKARIMDYLRYARRCSRSDLHIQVFSKNLKAAILDAAIYELVIEDKIRTGWTRKDSVGGDGRRRLSCCLMIGSEP
jgi:hypothetical protein